MNKAVQILFLTICFPNYITFQKTSGVIQWKQSTVSGSWRKSASMLGTTAWASI